MPQPTKNWELCIACGCTRNSKGDEFCRECGYEIQPDDDDDDDDE